MLLAALLAGVAGMAGCSVGRVQYATLDFRAIDPPAPEFGELPLHEAHWFADEAGVVWIALRHELRAPFVAQPLMTFQMSLRVERLPRGAAGRNYLVRKEELRAWARVGPLQSRLESISGILALYREPGDIVRGSFRMLAQRESANLLGGWSRPARTLLLGSFRAKQDEPRTRAVVAATESAGFERPK